MPEEHLGYLKTAERFGARHKRVQEWEGIYLLEGQAVFAIERRSRGGTDRPRKLSKSVRANTKCCTTRENSNYTALALPKLSDNLSFAKFDFNGGRIRYERDNF